MRNDSVAIGTGTTYMRHVMTTTSDNDFIERTSKKGSYIRVTRRIRVDIVDAIHIVYDTIICAIIVCITICVVDRVNYVVVNASSRGRKYSRIVDRRIFLDSCARN